MSERFRGAVRRSAIHIHVYFTLLYKGEAKTLQLGSRSVGRAAGREPRCCSVLASPSLKLPTLHPAYKETTGYIDHFLYFACLLMVKMVTIKFLWDKNGVNGRSILIRPAT